MKRIESKEALQSWEDYQEFLRTQLKILDGAEGPFFVSKDRLPFEIAGKAWNGHAVLVGPKGLVCARKLQKEGVIFREGTCTRSGKELQVGGLDDKLVKEAARTLKKLRLGYGLAGFETEGESAPDDAPPSGASVAEAPAAAGADAGLVERAAKIAKAVRIWSKTEAAATKELRKLQKALLALDDPRSKPVIQGLEGILARIDTVDDEASAVAAAAQAGDATAFDKARTDFVAKLEGVLARVQQDELIRMADSNPLLEVKIRDTYTKSLTQLLQAL